LPSVLATKLARLRVSAQSQPRKRGPKPGALRSSQYGTGVRTRRAKSLNAALTEEALPPATTAPDAERRVLVKMGLNTFVNSLHTESRKPKRRSRSVQIDPAPCASA